jgi:hypothetical protein
MTETFIKERTHNLTGKVEKVGIDDACAFLARFNNGSLATFESPVTPAATRRSTPSKSTAKKQRSPLHEQMVGSRPVHRLRIQFRASGG